MSNFDVLFFFISRFRSMKNSDFGVDAADFRALTLGLVG